MKTLSSNITITQQGSGRNKTIYFDFVCSVNIKEDITTLTDTAKVILPSHILSTQKEKLLELLRNGDKINIKLGYDGVLKQRFNGYIKTIKHLNKKSPIEFECEDEMYVLKKKVVSKAYKSVNLQQLFKDICPEYNKQIVDRGVGQLKIDRATVAKTLDELKTKYGILTYFVNGKLFSGLDYWMENENIAKFKFGYNIITDEIQFVKADDVKIKLIAISILPNNKKIEIEIGDADGETRKFWHWGISEIELRKFAEQELLKFKYDGARDKFTTFGEPFVQKGNVADLEYPEYPECNGKYLIKSVEVNFGTKGYRQIIELDRKV